MQLTLDSEQAMEQLGAALAARISAPFYVYLQGDLGAGKTTLTRGFLHAKGHQGLVKSPTYTLVEPYDLGTEQIFHMDLYRLADGSELDFIGIRDMQAHNCIGLVEWPEKGHGHLPAADLVVQISIDGLQRRVGMTSVSHRGAEVLQNLSSSVK